MGLRGFISGLFGQESPYRKQAEQDANNALQSATDQNDLIKKIVLQNQAIASGLGDQWFGASPDDIAQQLADKRAASAHDGAAIVGWGTNGQPIYGAAPAGPGASAPTKSTSAKLPQGWTDPLDPKNIAEEYKYYRKQYPNISLDEYTRMVQEANPDGRPRKQLPAAPGEPPKYVPVTDDELAKARSSGQYVPAGTDTSAAQHAAITDADRQEAQRQYEVNKANTLPGQLDASRQRRQGAVDAFTNAIDGIKSAQAGDYNNKWNVDANKQYVSAAAKAAQQTAMDKTLALTDTKETAAEKLMREMARREQEQTLRSQSEAQANQLRSRGAYGSGAEIAGFLGNQQEQAQRRSLEEMQANANAQQRAMQALTAYGNQSFQLGQQDQATGALQDANSRFNSQSQQQWQQFKTKTQQQENEAAAKRAASKLDATNAQENVARGDIAQVADRQAQIAGLKTGANTTGAQLSGQAAANTAGAWNNKAGIDAGKADNDESLLNL